MLIFEVIKLALEVYMNMKKKGSLEQVSAIRTSLKDYRKGATDEDKKRALATVNQLIRVRDKSPDKSA